MTPISHNDHTFLCLVMVSYRSQCRYNHVFHGYRLRSGAIISLSLLQWSEHKISQIANFMGPTWGPPGSCQPQMGPMLAPRTLLSGIWIKFLRTDLPNAANNQNNDNQNKTKQTRPVHIFISRSFVSYQSIHPSLKHNNFKIWHWK